MSRLDELDPRRVDYPARVALALSILGHADEQHWRVQRERAVLALRGATITELQEVVE